MCNNSQCGLSCCNSSGYSWVLVLVIIILLLGGLYGLALLRRELVAGKHTGTRSTKAFMN